MKKKYKTMIEDEIIKHTRKTFSISKISGKSLRNKIVEILIEILIIFAAVTISIWLDDWSQKKHDQKEEKEFLSGLKTDLQNDIENMVSSKRFYKNSILGMNYFLGIDRKTTINKDSINKYSGIFFSSTNLDPQIGRYEGLKSSGRFKIIENKELLNSIISLHETIIKRIEYLNEMYYKENQKLEDLISLKVKFGEDGKIANIESIINESDFKMRLSLNKGLIENNVIPIHETGIKECNEIFNQIDKEIK
jgi:hypothetical protein